MFSQTSSHNPNGHYEVPQTPNEMISCLEWSPSSDILFSGSWDKGVKKN
jgi:WD40 repeat protein